MRNVDRVTAPRLLQLKFAQWTKDLLAEIKKAKKAGRKVSKKFTNRYKKTSILAALREMYGPYCCYCESRVPTAGFQHIEHRMPRDKFPELTFEWNNLHLSCAPCNKHKANHWDAAYPILDAVKDVPIAQHLGYELYYRLPKTARGKTTWEHTDLDRDPDSGLLHARQQVWEHAMKLIEKIKRHPTAPAVASVKRELRRKCSEEFGSMIQDLIDIHAI